jgi:CheY-like chemotaxis protein
MAGVGASLRFCCLARVKPWAAKLGFIANLDKGQPFGFRYRWRSRNSTKGAANLPKPTTPPANQPMASSSTVRLLIVEDYEDNRDILLMLLDSLGYEADAVVNGQDFLDRMAEQDYDIVLMDCQMPVLDGYAATRQLRQREGTQKRTVVIGVTAHAMERDRQTCLDAGMDDYLTKPIELDELAQILRHWIAR